MDPRVHGLWDYIEATYVRGRIRGNLQGAPLFAPRMWNTYTSVLQGIHRTNNMAESWHAKFLKMIVTPHSSLWKFIDFMKKDEKDINILITQLEGGHSNIKYPGRKLDLKNEELVQKIVRSYPTYKRDGTIHTYLRALSARQRRIYVAEEEDNDEEE